MRRGNGHCRHEVPTLCAPAGTGAGSTREPRLCGSDPGLGTAQGNMKPLAAEIKEMQVARPDMAKR